MTATLCTSHFFENQSKKCFALYALLPFDTILSFVHNQNTKSFSIILLITQDFKMLRIYSDLFSFGHLLVSYISLFLSLYIVSQFIVFIKLMLFLNKDSLRKSLQNLFKIRKSPGVRSEQSESSCGTLYRKTIPIKANIANNSMDFTWAIGISGRKLRSQFQVANYANHYKCFA